MIYNGWNQAENYAKYDGRNLYLYNYNNYNKNIIYVNLSNFIKSSNYYIPRNNEVIPNNDIKKYKIYDYILGEIDETDNCLKLMNNKLYFKNNFKNYFTLEIYIKTNYNNIYGDLPHPQSPI